MSTTSSLESWKGNRKKTLLPLAAAGLALLLCFLGNMSLLFGAGFEQRYRTHALNVLVVDFDQDGSVTQALSSAYESIKGNTFPTLKFQDPSSQYAQPEDVQDAVCKDGYWAAMYVHPGASSRLTDAVAGGPSSSSSTQYNPDDTISYIYNAARYANVADGVIRSNLEALIAASRGTWYQTDAGQSALSQLNASDPAAVQAFLDPIQPSPFIIAPTAQGARAYYNTLNVVFPILLAFFFLLAVNGVMGSAGIFARLPWRDVWFMRFVAAKVYTCLAALVIAGYIWAFREDWAVPASGFPKTWMIIWFQMVINWQVFDSLIGSFLPLPAAPFFMLTWVLANVASTANPLLLAPGFYRAGYAMPGYNIYSLEVRAWTGCTRTLHINLPVLFAWWLLGLLGTAVSARKQCSDARRAVEQVSDSSMLQEEKRSGEA
ncbi:uncharacterized protein J7T54_004385 [Emericellopsis cladophorae]|uniref:DUF3533 domain-containing protein n=1 Tax=Emericellopsis cladophorae TaxID=2686198 RepID=A0A9P9Y494_9HYPO|nr:uncharacterized protein J7T54_004385 [Emericellopsis cladophorae]KAI6783358.1 hypothetical protein J7T54_004385 [Emericellopsis cladophorae]